MFVVEVKTTSGVNSGKVWLLVATVVTITSKTYMS